MDWRIKATIQKSIAMLPAPLSGAAYYGVQRCVGGLRQLQPRVRMRLCAAVQTWERICACGVDPVDKVFFEVGTGIAPIVPIGFWLMGASRTVTVDLHRYVRHHVVRETVSYIQRHSDELSLLFRTRVQPDRMQRLLQLDVKAASLSEILQTCGIEYRAPADAAKTGLKSESVDFHTSYTVFEHIPRDTLARILREGNRIVKRAGLFVHLVDYSDHFSHSDPKISAINFLQYSDEDWNWYAGNRYMYMNRLRHDDMLALFDSVGHSVVDVTAISDSRARDLLDAHALPLNGRFRDKPADVLAVREAWVVSRPLGDSRSA